MKSKFKIKDYDKARKIAGYCEVAMMIFTVIAGLIAITNILLLKELLFIYFVALVISAISVTTGIISTILKKGACVIDIDDIWNNFLTIFQFILIGIVLLFEF